MLKLRLGIILIILSWLPFAQLLIIVAHSHNKLITESSATKFRLIVWAIQIVVGLIGLWLAGEVAIKTAKKDGLKQTPTKLWHLFWSGS